MLHHAYPRELSLAVRRRLEEEGRSEPDAQGGGTWVRADALEAILSTCYQASLQREEGRHLAFRVALADPEVFPGLDRLVLSRRRVLDEHELRRIAPAVAFKNSLIGVSEASDGELYIWGLVHSGPGWLQGARGGRENGQSIPTVLTIAVTGPGRIIVSQGIRMLASLASGSLAVISHDVFSARWLDSLLARSSQAQWDAYVAACARSLEPHTSLEPAFGRKLIEHVLRRMVATVRASRHGGTFILLPTHAPQVLLAARRCLTLKYEFCDEEARRRVVDLTVELMCELSRLHASGTNSHLVEWSDYELPSDIRLARLDDTIFEVAHLVAMLAEIDGAVVMTDTLEILGFGAEISGALPDVGFVQRSLDLEGTTCVPEGVERVGTRHRSAYRLCQHLRDALVIVVSQDGGVRFVRWQDTGVTCFDQIATGPWEI